MLPNARRALLRVVVLSCSLGANSGCVALFKGRGDDVRFESDPPGASVSLDGEEIGHTPLTHWVHHGSHAVSMKKDGYDPATGVLQSSFSGWFLLDFIGTIGILVDVGFGTVSTLDAGEVALRLTQTAQRFRKPNTKPNRGNARDTPAPPPPSPLPMPPSQAADPVPICQHNLRHRISVGLA